MNMFYVAYLTRNSYIRGYIVISVFYISYCVGPKAESHAAVKYNM